MIYSSYWAGVHIYTPTWYLQCRSMLEKLAKVTIKFAPRLNISCSAREFLARVKTPRALASNPNCKIEVIIRHRASPDPYVELEYLNGKKDKIFTSELVVNQIMDRIRERSETLEARDMLTKAGLTKAKFEVTPQTQSNAGKSRDIPIFWMFPLRVLIGIMVLGYRWYMQ